MADLDMQPPTTLGAPRFVDGSEVLLRWLATLFVAPPTVEQIAAYRSGPGADMLDALAENPDLAPAVARMRQALSARPAAAAVAAEIATAFNLLFLGLGGPETVPPYESAYTSQRGTLFQDATKRMEEVLGALGLIASGLPNEPADHLSIELEAAAELIRRSDEERLAALDSRLLGWAPEFCRLVIARDRQGFYAGAAGLLLGILARRDPHPASTTFEM